MRAMTAEKATSTIASESTILRHRLAAPHNATTSTRQTRAAAKVPHGARWRNAKAKVSAPGAWCRNGRMINAGMKNNPMPASADTVKASHRERLGVEAGVEV